MKSRIPFIAAASALAITLAACGSGQSGSREQVRAVGSSTVYPFAKVVADRFAQSNAGTASPIIESTGTGAGIKLFCAGVGGQFPDIANASRRMKKSEYDDCAKNGVTDVVEIQVGLDGITLGEAKGGLSLPLTQAMVYKAIAANPFGKPNTAKTWKDVDASLPAEPILVYGPPSSSGTRDSLKELILIKGCESDPAMKALKDSDKEQHEKICTEVRGDGLYVDSGENDNLIVQKLESNPKAVGIFGFSYLEENMDKLQRPDDERRHPQLSVGIRFHLSRGAAALYLREVGASGRDQGPQGICRAVGGIVGQGWGAGQGRHGGFTRHRPGRQCRDCRRADQARSRAAQVVRQRGPNRPCRLSYPFCLPSGSA